MPSVPHFNYNKIETDNNGDYSEFPLLHQIHVQEITVVTSIANKNFLQLFILSGYNIAKNKMMPHIFQTNIHYKF